MLLTQVKGLTILAVVMKELQLLIKNHGVNETARRIGVSRITIFNWYKGRTKPQKLAVLRIRQVAAEESLTAPK